jgi:hypothetical protein
VYPTITINNDSLMSIRGIEYMYDIGEMNMPLSSSQGTFSFSGKRLQRITINADGTQENYFRATEIQINNAINIKEFIVQGVNTMTNALDLSKCTRLEKIIITGTTTPNIKLPASETLKELRRPATLLSLSVTANPNLETVTFEGAQYLRDVTINQAMAGALNSFTIASMMYQAGVTPTHISLTNLSWVGADIDVLMWLCDNDAELTGTIKTLESTFRYLSYNEKMRLANKYKNIDSVKNKIYITYLTSPINTFNIHGDLYIWTLGEHEYYAEISSGNNILLDDNGVPVMNFALAPEAASYATINDNGIITLNQLIEGGKFDMSCTISLTDGSVLTKTKKIGFWHRVPITGDFAYADGFFADSWDTSRTCVGIVYMVKKMSDIEYLIYIVSLKEITLTSEDGAFVTVQQIWGLSLVSGSNPEGLSADIGNAIVAATNVRNAYDIFEIANIPAFNDVTYSASTYFNDDTESGFNEAPPYSWVLDFEGKSKSAAAITHCNKILKDYILLAKLPSNLTELADGMQKIEAANENNTRYRGFFYPAFYTCHLYEPTIENGEYLNPQYAKGNWYLPAIGQMIRIYLFTRYGVAASNANEDTSLKEAKTPIYANANKRAGKAVFSWRSVSYSSSSEVSNYSIVELQSNGTVRGANGNTYYSNRKGQNRAIRACVEYTFRLDEE